MAFSPAPTDEQCLEAVNATPRRQRQISLNWSGDSWV